MMIQLSAGQGPAECALAVCKLYAALCREYPDIQLISRHTAAHYPDIYDSIRFSTEYDLSFLEGSVLWICQSPFRPHHKRKNWFVDVSILEEAKPCADAAGKQAAYMQSAQSLSKMTANAFAPNKIGLSTHTSSVSVAASTKTPVISPQDLSISYFHCGGKGGQNVNKVQTGVRLVHLPTGICVTSTAERSQHLNRKDALQKLALLLSRQEAAAQSKKRSQAWQEHTRLVRGNPVRTYTGLSFARMH